MTQKLILRSWGRSEYTTVWRAMQEFTTQRGPDTADELWLVEHPPVYTLGLNGKRAHLRDAGEIPIISVDRGGQVTYHGPGQLIIYVLLDLHRAQWGVRRVVEALEQAVIDFLAELSIIGARRPGAPGVYVDECKIAALGLRVRRGCSYHGLSLNVNMDLSPFKRIDPCGYPGLAVTQLAEFDRSWTVDTAAPRLITHLTRLLE